MKLEELNNRTKDAVSYLVEALGSGQSEVLTQYLLAMGRFHNYSFGNIMLIARQKPDATNVAGLGTWNPLGRFVRRGERGIMILAPMIGHKKADSVTEATEGAKQSQAQLYGFRAVYVFDISQTEGKDLPTLTLAIPRTGPTSLPRNSRLWPTRSATRCCTRESAVP